MHRCSLPDAPGRHNVSLCLQMVQEFQALLYRRCHMLMQIAKGFS